MLRRNLRGFVLRTLAAAVLILGPGLIWLYSSWGQIQLVKWDIAKLSRGNDQPTLEALAGGFPFAGYREQAVEAAVAIADPFFKARALGDVARAMAQVGDASKTAELLKQAVDAAAAITSPSVKARALGDVARAMAQVASETKNTELLKQVVEAAAAITSPSDKAEALGDVARAMAQVASETKNTELLKQAVEAAAAIADPNDKGQALGDVAHTAAKLGHWRQALDYARRNSYDKGRAEALIAILQVWYGVERRKTDNMSVAD
jgi:hypothetical protein